MIAVYVIVYIIGYVLAYCFVSRDLRKIYGNHYYGWKEIFSSSFFALFSWVVVVVVLGIHIVDKISKTKPLKWL